MSSQLIFSIKSAMVRFKEYPIFQELDLNIHQGKRIALIGKNGAGKSTILNIISGRRALDEGKVWQEPGTSIGFLGQEFNFVPHETVFDFIYGNIEGEDKELYQYKVDIIAEALKLDKKMSMGVLSGGQLRRAGLARALVEEPTILLLDEPTNHLDLKVIRWLEQYLTNYKGSLVCISHDKAFLENISNQVFWLDRGGLKVSPRGFKFFDEWSTMILDQEARELKRRKQIVAQEIEWASRGVKARVKRNIRRLLKVKEMRENLQSDEASFRRATKTISLSPIQNFENNSKVIAEFHRVYKTFISNNKEIKILNDFNLRIKRGDRIGVIGENGSGKTTFLKLILKHIQPDQGTIKVQKQIEFSYFDQNRSDLKPTDTLKDFLAPNGGDYIEVRGKSRHIYGYLKDFMFEPNVILDKVSTLSGGQKNRLKLAKILANPKSCLILDEPTNDLDMETLDMLGEILINYEGTLILVSHDRDFLDQTVTKIIAFEGNGVVTQCVGGYSDYLHTSAKSKNLGSISDSKHKQSSQKSVNKQSKTKQDKLTYKLEFELKNLPEKIQKKEREIEFIVKQLSNPNLYLNSPADFTTLTEKLELAKVELEKHETRWLELEIKKG